jgi:murein DD-endopeptidase MepM/ murein hydrolase activator NlpD
VLQRGETIYRLSRHYGVPVRDIVRANRIRDVSDVPVGARLVIPGALRAAPEASIAMASREPPGGSARERALREAALMFEWPLQGRFSSGYGRRGLRKHDGIDISARRGTPVRAAEAGRVIESGWLGDYGRVVIVKHAGRYSTVYAHNSRNRVRKGEFVEKGQVLAEVGASGNASGPHLHFEIRRGRSAENPAHYLPSAPAARR